MAGHMPTKYGGLGIKITRVSFLLLQAAFLQVFPSLAQRMGGRGAAAAKTKQTISGHNGLPNSRLPWVVFMGTEEGRPGVGEWCQRERFGSSVVTSSALHIVLENKQNSNQNNQHIRDHSHKQNPLWNSQHYQGPLNSKLKQPGSPTAHCCPARIPLDIISRRCLSSRRSWYCDEYTVNAL